VTGILGPGVKVWVGWADQVNRSHQKSMCQVATVLAGPYKPGDVLYDGRFNATPNHLWRIRMQAGGIWYAAEQLLIPLDDGDQVDVTEALEETA
jgi:hypothetical protein